MTVVPSTHPAAGSIPAELFPQTMLGAGGPQSDSLLGVHQAVQSRICVCVGGGVRACVCACVDRSQPTPVSLTWLAHTLVPLLVAG
jgi:hypothetical protein